MKTRVTSGQDSFPKSDVFYVDATDANGNVYFANDEFATIEEANEFASRDFCEDDYYFYQNDSLAGHLARARDDWAAGL